mmetsp:Transcript_49806/g.95192  ORF Transcript_49806/g.95192 Transcript_49806/m.95192 type:complete len:662 (-) Transcript_49806:364-2349(-)|eukprot:CAMPEP_0114252508 /NCGR_PEP_ID=MMETSP0058-20121206/15875_1 /TAXON_ID=36894 /ORGANISM="Pyramimonas parkeae, CCMP726" /LENGTH=661 /DNA_ID=CAMNT_0001366449 /DNA_START=144 /DNA_END=2129 /DNA_ORIENTATION=-
MNSDLAELIEHTVREKVKVSSNIEAFDRREQANNERSHSHDGVPVPDVPIPGTMQEEEAPHFSLVAYFAYAGPGLLVAAAYTDPGSVETALAAGTFFGYQLLWVLVWILVPACLLQSQAVRLAVVTNQDLAHLVRNEYAASPNVRNLVIATSHAALVSHLIPQVYATAFALWQLLNVPQSLGACLAGVWALSILAMRGDRSQAKGLEAMFGFGALVVLLCGLASGLLAVSSLVNPWWDLSQAAVGLVLPIVPSSNAFFLVASMFAAAAMPHNLYLHSHLALTRNVANNAQSCKVAVFYNTCDVGIALGVSLVANISFVFAGAAVGDNAWASSSAGTALLDDPLYGAARVLSERAWGGPAAVCLLSGVVLVASVLAATAAAHAGQVMTAGMLLSNRQATLEPWSYLGRVVPMAWAVAAVVMAGKSHGPLMLALCSLVAAVCAPFSIIPLVKLSCSPWITGPLHGGSGLTWLCWVNVAMLVAANAMMLLFGISSSATPFDTSALGGNLGMHAGMWLVTTYLFAVVGLAFYPVQQNLVSSSALHTVLGKHRLQNAMMAEEYRLQGVGAPESAQDVDQEGYGYLQQNYVKDKYANQYKKSGTSVAVNNPSKALELLGGRLPNPRSRTEILSAAKKTEERNQGPLFAPNRMVPRTILADRILDVLE